MTMREDQSEVAWLRSTLVTLLVLAEASPSPLTNENVVAICRTALDRHRESIVDGETARTGKKP
jgi:hypothetical protein